MARSTKLQKVVTDVLANRITTTESGITAIQARNLLDAGDNVSELNNDAGYQNATQVDAKIAAVVGAAPAALDTLGEIATALADDDSAIAALIAQDTANATAIASVQTELDALENSLNPVLAPITTSVELFIDNVNGSDSTVNPTLNTSPCKTFQKALEYVEKHYYFVDASNNYINLTLLSDYTFGAQESTYLNGANILGFTSIRVASDSSTIRQINCSYRKAIKFENFGHELTLEDLNFTSRAQVAINNVRYVNAARVEFQELEVSHCEGFYDNDAITLNATSKFSNIYYIDIVNNSLINSHVIINDAFEINFGGTFTATNGRFEINRVYYANLAACIFNESALNSTDYSAFEIRDVNNLNLAQTITLNSTTGIIERQLFNITNSSISFTYNTTLSFRNTYSSSIVNKARRIIQFNNSQINNLQIAAASGSFQPTFVAENATKKLIELAYSNYKSGSSESSVATSVYSSSSRLITFDKYSEYLGENYLDLRGKIRRLVLTTDITLTSSDASTQNLINQTASDRNIGLPASPFIDQYFEVINHPSSTHNLLFATETVIPSARHAVQYDGTEWVVM